MLQCAGKAGGLWIRLRAAQGDQSQINLLLYYRLVIIMHTEQANEQGTDLLAPTPKHLGTT